MARNNPKVAYLEEALSFIEKEIAKAERIRQEYFKAKKG
jgi:uncharacterized protein (DUF3084 family)